MTVSKPLLHIIGAGPWQVRTIERARAMGVRVLVSDGFEQRPGYALADLHERADITNPEATLAVARRHGISGVLCDTTDNGVLTAAYVADALGLPGISIEAARCCTDKDRMTQVAARAGLRVPSTHRVRSIAEAWLASKSIGWPLVVKPVDNQSGRGVTKVDAEDRFAAACEAAFAFSRSGAIAVQRHLDGPELIVDSIVIEGQVVRLGIGCKTPFTDNPTISSRITYGEDVPPAQADRIDEVNRRLIQALGLRQGLVHAEFIVAADGEPQPIDVAARGGGVLIYPRVLPHVSGIDVMRAAIELALGRKPVGVRPDGQGRGANIEFLRAGPGLLRAVDRLDEARALPGIDAIHLNVLPGQELHRLTHKDHRLGFIVALAASAEEAFKSSRMAAEHLDIRVDPEGGLVHEIL